MNKSILIILLFLSVLLVTDIVFAQPKANSSSPDAVAYADPTYGGKIRQINKPDGHEHNIYYHRNPWNADNTYMVGVQSDLNQKNWQVVLYDGDGRMIKNLFSVDKYDWRLVWDRNHPKILYTWRGGNLYKYDVTANSASLLKSFAPLKLGLMPNGPSLNQAGDRIMVITSDGTFRSYHLPDMQDERTFKAKYPPGCSTGWKDERYIGYQNYISTICRSDDLAVQAILVYDDTGKLFHRLDGIGGGGHFDFSPDGKLAYFKKSRWSGNPLEIHVINLDGTNDTVVYSAPQSRAQYVQNLHLSWPDKVKDWFVASFFPSSGNMPPAYAPPLDEILKITVTGKVTFLARTHTKVAPRSEVFWDQPLASPSSDGKRITYNTNRSGTVDICILSVD